METIEIIELLFSGFLIGLLTMYLLLQSRNALMNRIRFMEERTETLDLNSAFFQSNQKVRKLKAKIKKLNKK